MKKKKKTVLSYIVNATLKERRLAFVLTLLIWDIKDGQWKLDHLKSLKDMKFSYIQTPIIKEKKRDLQKVWNVWKLKDLDFYN